MLSSINLMSWRANLLLERRKRLLTLVVLSLLLSLLILLVIGRYLSGQIEIQLSRLTQLDGYISLQQNKMELAEQANNRFQEGRKQQLFLQAKLAERNATTFLMNLLTEWLPQGVRLTKVSRNMNRVEITGLAANSLQIEHMVNQLRLSEHAEGISVHSIESASETSQQFVISLSLQFPALNGGSYVAKPTD
ncbi:PilN domain-containing protein [Vibrio sp. SCSIO 43137]|uniref:PilN domain-containing protein n=1 Tax=Vibrio sp. SCSIO 43137 TaxID=3021011 RepID=UPI0023082F6C|nr:PilN domain-containing protein [Vibrio sp. SCSIO 43137]WCE29907.1 PilN domain-containing protein [Vibrio sp. SCSIO 43137]